MSYDVVAKLDAWLKEHHRQAHEDYLEGAISDLIGIREELEEVEPVVRGVELPTGALGVRWCINALNDQIHALNLALDAARERAS